MYDPSRLEPEGPQRQPIFRVPPATFLLAISLILVFLLLRLLGDAEVEWLLITFGFQPDRFLWALEGRGDLLPTLWPLATHLWLHYDALHLIVNCGFLLAFASVVERRFGAALFLLLFLFCGAVGALAQVWLVFEAADRASLLIGASGGIFGLMGVAILAGGSFLRARAGRVILVLMAINVGIGLLSEVGMVGGYLIGWQAHAGGFLAGLLVGWLVSRRDPAGPLPRL